MKKIVDELLVKLAGKNIMYVYIDKEEYEKGYATLYINTESCHKQGILSDDGSEEEEIIADVLNAERAGDATYDVPSSISDLAALMKAIAEKVPQIIFTEAPF